MSNPFAITAATNTVSLNSNRQGQASFIISNMTAQTIRGRAHVVAPLATAGPWLTLLGEAERDFASSGSQQYAVQITVPPGAPAGDYIFRLNVVDLVNPDDDFSEGPTVRFVVTPPEQMKKPFPWLIVLMIAGALVLLVGGIYGIIQVNHKAPPIAVIPTPTPTFAPPHWQNSVPVLTARAAFSTALGPNGRIYAIGGFTTSNSTLNTVEVYDVKTNTWTTVAPMLTSRSLLAAVTGKDGRIYAIGGYTNASILNTVEAYDTRTNTWVTLAPMPTARYGLAAALGPDGRIYAIGGYSSAGPFNTVEAYDTKTNTWTALAPMASPRAALVAVTGTDGRIYAIGGAINNNVLSTVEAYDTKTNTWTTVAPMSTPRYISAAALGPDGRIYVIGGYTNATILNTVEAYDTKTNTWTTVASMPTARYGLAAALGPDGRIYAIGGYTAINLAPNSIINKVEALSER